MRAISRLALRISLGVSRRSVADWKRRWKRCLSSSFNVSPSCSSPMPRYSSGFMVRLLHAGPPGHEAAAEGHLVSHAGQALARRRLGQAANLEQDHAGLDDRGPVFGLAFALAHARLGRDGGDRLVRKDPDVQAPLAAHRVGGRDAAGFDRFGAQPTPFERLQAEVAELDRVAAAGVTFYFAALTFSELYPLRHERHGRPPRRSGSLRY